jgi:RNA polymerase sigma factor (sigma-70 family)
MCWRGRVADRGAGVDSSGQEWARDVVARVRDGDRAAWTELADRYSNLLWSIARGLGLNSADAGDAVQMTWLRLVERIDTVRQPEYLGRWLATTARRECLAILRQRARERITARETWEDLPDPAGELDEALLREERDAALWSAFGELRHACRALLRVLMSDPEPSYAEVSAALDIPIGSIGPTRQRCLRQLRQILAAGGEPDGAGCDAARRGDR